MKENFHRRTRWLRWLFAAHFPAAMILAAFGALHYRNFCILMVVWLIGLCGWRAAVRRSRWGLALAGFFGGYLFCELWAFAFLIASGSEISVPGFQAPSAQDQAITLDEDVYRVDAKGRRIENEEDDARYEKHALFFGGSFMFGLGVLHEETLPEQFEALAGGQFHAYNYGANGQGPERMLQLLERGEPFADVAEPAGIAVYAFIDDHLNRATPYSYFQSAYTYPHSDFYETNAAGELVGPFALTDDPARMRKLKWFKRAREFSPLYRALTRRYPPRFHSETEAFETVARLILRSRDLYRRRFDGDFYVLLWPREVKTRPNLERFVRRLEEAGVRVVRVPPMPDAQRARLGPNDPHPGPAEHRHVAANLMREISRRAKY